MHFDLEYSDDKTNARVGTITTDHGKIQTPIFMPVGTLGTVKGVHQHELKEDIKAQIILGNTYHLYFKPGIDVLGSAGGLHRFNHWDGPILTDSGGFQVYSLSKTRKITEEGVKFQSIYDGSYHFFTPEYAMDVERIIGGDIMMAFDECTPFPCDYRYAKNSLKITHNWLDRCVHHFNNTNDRYDYTQALFPIVQGSVYKDLRVESAKHIASKEMPGNAIGGLSVGEPEEQMYEMIEVVNEHLPKDKPRYLMGVGTPWNILEGIALGIDMFDCVMPSRNARHGLLFTWDGLINIKNKKWEKDFSPLDEKGKTYVDSFYSKAYLRHLIKMNEYLGIQIATIHNLGFYLDLVTEARKHILIGDYEMWKNTIIPQLKNRR